MSLGFLLPRRGDAVVWRGPKKTAMVRQFLSDVLWGETDFLVVDTPPRHERRAHLARRDSAAEGGTGAASRRRGGDDAAGCGHGRRAQGAQLLRQDGIRVLGVVENMSGFVCPNCSECTDIFMSGGGSAMAADFGVAFLGSVPVDPQFLTLIETGRRPRYPAGTSVNGHDVSARPANGLGAGGQQPEDGGREPGSLADKYRDCSLYPVFQSIALSVVDAAGAAEP